MMGEINTTYNRNAKMNQQSNMRETLNRLNSVITGKRILNEGRVGQIADDLESLSDAEFQKEYGKTKAEMRKSFSTKETVKEDADHLDPNLSKAYNLGNETYLAYKNDPELAQAAQDKFESMEIVKQNPQYAKMWVTGYRDGERFDKSGVAEGSEILKVGSSVRVPHNGKMVPGKIVRYESSKGGHSPAYVVDIGEYESKMIPVHAIKQGVAEGSENLAIGEKMARDGIEYDPAREGEIISMIGDYLRRDGMTTRQVRGYMMDNDFVSDQLSYLPRKSGVAEAGDPNRFDPRASRKHPGDVDENFGGGMRDRPGPEHKSFDLAEAIKLFNK